MFLLFELIMRYCDYETFRNCSILNQECNKICRKLAFELKRIKKYNHNYQFYEVYWNMKKQGLCYYINDNILHIIDYKNGEIIAHFYYNFISEYIEIDYRQYLAKLNYQNREVNFEKIPNYHRAFLSLKPIANFSFFE